MKLQFAFYDENDSMLVDLSRWVTRLVSRLGAHGFESLDAEAWADMFDVTMLLRNRRPHRVQLNFGVLAIWEGRLEDVSIEVDGFRGTAFGFWRALKDVVYTALWSWKSYAGYYQVTDDDWAITNPAKFRLDNNNRVYIAPVSGEVYASGGASDVGAFVFWAPHNGERQIKKVTFSYDVDLPTGWVAQVVSVDEGFSSGNTEHTVTTSGSGSATVTLGTDKDGLVFWIYNNSGSKGTYTGETGAKYAKWTNIRVWTTDSSNVYADEIVEGLLSFVNGINSGLLSSSTVLIESPAVDLTDELYEDVLPADVIEDLAGRGDNSSPPETYEAGVNGDRILYFRPLGSEARRWMVDVADLALERSMEPVVNSVYAVYESGSGRRLRTAVSADDDSIDAYGLTRRRPVTARTTSAGQAGTARDAELAQKAFPPPRVSRLSLWRILTKHGLDAWPWEPQPGDVVEIRNLPPELAVGDDVVTDFTIERAEYDPLAVGRGGSFGQLSIETRSLSPTIEAYLSVLLKQSALSGSRSGGAAMELRN